MDKKNIVKGCLIGAAVCGIIAAAVKIVKDINDEKKYINIFESDDDDEDDWDDDIADEL